MISLTSSIGIHQADTIAPCIAQHWSFFSILAFHKTDTTMAKSKDAKKDVKKVATKTKDEKRADKRDKKPKYD